MYKTINIIHALIIQQTNIHIDINRERKRERDLKNNVCTKSIVCVICATNSLNK
jgi:hypothetical protein